MILTPLTQKECNTSFPQWTLVHQYTFESKKHLVVSQDCLTTIDHENPGENKIFVTCNASKRWTGAILAFGLTWEMAKPMASESRQLNNTEWNYPVHEQEMLRIVWALCKWRVGLLGTHIHIHTDHKTLQNFDFQRDLSQHQAWWMEYFSQYKYTITYINGKHNTVADGLSHLPDSIDNELSILLTTSVFTVKSNLKVITCIKNGYQEDPWCIGILDDLKWGIIDAKLHITIKNGFLFVRTCLIIPKYKQLCEQLFQLAHDNFRHFGTEKSYENLWDNFYWSNMRKDLGCGYIPGCPDCQCNKATTSKWAEPLHPLPIPDNRFDSVAINFIGPLPRDEGFNTIVSMTDRLGADIQVAACKSDMNAEDFVYVFFNKWDCENRCPLEIISNRDKLFISKFWRVLMKLTGIDHKLSTLYHPQTNGLSERMNKTVIQCLQFHIECNQKGWVKALLKVWFDIMNTINASTSFLSFMLKTGHTGCRAKYSCQSIMSVSWWYS